MINLYFWKKWKKMEQQLLVSELVPQEVWDEMFNKEIEEKIEEITLSQMNLADFEDRFIEPLPPTLWSRFKSALSKLF